MSDELREKVARAVALADAKDGCSETLLRSESYMAACRNIADAAIALIWNEAMEEAAKVADEIGYKKKDGGLAHGAFACADAIRSLMSKP